jgi:hypothetical protein
MFAILHAIGMFVVDLFKSRGAGLKPRIRFAAINSPSLCGGHHLVFDCMTVIARCSYG